VSESRTILHRQHDLCGIADNNMFDVPFAVNQNTDLPSDLMRYFAELARKLRSNDFDRWDATLIDLFQPPQLIGP